MSGVKNYIIERKKDKSKSWLELFDFLLMISKNLSIKETNYRYI